MDDDAFVPADLIACGYVLPPNAEAVLDIDYRLLERTLRAPVATGDDAATGEAPDSAVLAD
jgi:hypothetical protein